MTNNDEPSTCDDEASKNVTVEQDAQKVRAFLRERFLRALNALSGKRMEILMREKTNVSAEFGASDIEFEHIQVTSLQTPMGRVPDALLRTSDIISIKIPLDLKPIWRRWQMHDIMTANSDSDYPFTSILYTENCIDFQGL